MMNASRRRTSPAVALGSRERNHLRIFATAALFSLAALALLLPRPGLAQTGLSKCTDGNRITYSSTACGTIGLKEAGQINDRLTIIPAMDALRKPAVKQPAQTAAVTAAAKEVELPRGANIQPVNPMVQGLLKK